MQRFLGSIRAKAAVVAMAMTVPTVGTIMWLTAPPAAALAPVNPVEVPLAGHPANSGFLVFVEGNVTLRNDESEGTTALGGTLHESGVTPVTEGVVDGVTGPESPVGKVVDETVGAVGGLLHGDR